MLLDAQIEDVPESPFPKTAGPDGSADAGIHRKIAFEGKGSKSLDDLSAAEFFLKHESTEGPFLTEAVADLLRDVVAATDHRLTIGPSLKNSNVEIRKIGKERRRISQAKTQRANMANSGESYLKYQDLTPEFLSSTFKSFEKRAARPPA